MDVNEESEEIIKRCFKCSEHVISNLNVVNNKWNTTFTLWNRFQIFVYENLDFENVSKVIIPEFQISHLIMANNYLISTDCTGNVHTTSLKFKNPTQKKFKYSFQPKESGILVCSLFSEDQALCLKYEAGAHFLSIHKMNSEFTLEKRAIVTGIECLQTKREKYLLKSYPISENHIESVKTAFQMQHLRVRGVCNLVIASFDKFNIYGCLFSPKMYEDEVALVKLYTCPSEICSIKFIDADNLIIVVALTIGTVYYFNVNISSIYRVLNFNISINKFTIFNDTILYTDGSTMWKAENLLSPDVVHSQLFVKDVKDFIKFGDQILCTTFNDLIYTFSIDDERSYTQPPTVEQYCAAETFLKRSDYVKKVNEEVLKNTLLLELQAKENRWVTALCASNRPDVMSEFIQQEIVVYDSYEDAVADNNNIILTQQFSEYYDTDSLYVLVTLTIDTKSKLHETLTNAIGDLRIHIVIAAKTKIIKTITIKVTSVLTTSAYLIPLKECFVNTTEMNIHIKIVTDMPGPIDPKQKVWTLLYSDKVMLKSENFAKLTLNTSKNVCLKKSKLVLEDLINQSTTYLYGDSFDFTTNSEMPVLRKWKMYVRLPNKYREVFKNESIKNLCPTRKEKYFLQQFSSNQFLESRSNITVFIIQEKVTIEIDDDGFSNPMLKISCNDKRVALNIRNFLANLIYCVFPEFEPNKQFVSLSFCITVENMERAIREAIDGNADDPFIELIEQFERKIIGSLPI